MNKITLTLDLNKKPTTQHVYMSASDKSAPEIVVRVADNGHVLTMSDLTGFTRRMKIRKPNGGVYSQSSRGTYEDGRIIFNLQPETNSVGAGDTFGYVELSKNDQILSTARFTVTVLDAAEVN